MCGIVGVLTKTSTVCASSIRNMARMIEQRGPDSEGQWVDKEVGIGLGHRRLSVVDLSPAGHQPMHSVTGHLVLVFNGEIYNHKLLRTELENAGWAYGWRGHSDTETLLAALQLWGIEKTLPRLNGMFSFALWDRKKRVLQLARDRLGEKPLYYGVVRNTFLFGSELKALRAHPDWDGEIDRRALALFLRHTYVPEPRSIYRGISKLAAGHWIEIRTGQIGVPKCYWDLSKIVLQPRSSLSEADLINDVEGRLLDAVRLRMEADVPLGAFLSGGIDSSLIVALMQAQSSAPVRTFTIGFDVPGYNEAAHAKAVASHLGTEHSELYLTPADALNVVPDLPRIWDEPFADSSQIPSFLLSKLTRQHVTVALSGDAGDEVFGGYNRYGRGFEVFKRLSRLPVPIKRGVALFLSMASTKNLDRILSRFPRDLAVPALGDRLAKLSAVSLLKGTPDYYNYLISQSYPPEGIMVSEEEATSILPNEHCWPDLSDFREVMMYLDTRGYLPGDILTKVDRSTMAVGLEARVPFLDHNIVEMAWSLPMDVKIRNGETKWILRQILDRYVPRHLVNRPKSGFGIPIDHWLTGELRAWAEDLLNRDALHREGLFKPEIVQRMWDEHLSGRRRWHHQLWTVLMFRAWHLLEE